MNIKNQYTPLASPEINQTIQDSTPSVAEESQLKDIPKKDSKILKVVIYILSSIILLALGAFGFWAYQRKVANKLITPHPLPVITPMPLTTAIPSPTGVDLSTELLEPSLVPTRNWQTVSLPQNVRISQGGDTKPAQIKLKIPLNWSSRTVKIREGEGIGGSDCNDFNIDNEDKSLLLVIKPNCRDTDNDYLPISGKVQKVELITNKGNDSHDSYTVRYFDKTKNVYHYGSIDVSPGASIDILKDKIYPNLVLQYEPDRYEQWLWTSYDLTYKGTASNQQTALTTADTIISTLRLTD